MLETQVSEAISQYCLPFVVVAALHRTQIIQADTFLHHMARLTVVTFLSVVLDAKRVTWYLLYCRSEFLNANGFNGAK